MTARPVAFDHLKRVRSAADDVGDENDVDPPPHQIMGAGEVGVLVEAPHPWPVSAFENISRVALLPVRTGAARCWSPWPLRIMCWCWSHDQVSVSRRYAHDPTTV
jgi:hypothetical protein